MKHFIKTALFFCILITGVALAHAKLESSTPEDGSTVTSLEPVSLTFTEDVQTSFSFFKVYKLAEEGSLEDNQEKLKFSGLAGQLLSGITEDNAAAERVDNRVITTADTSDVIELELKQDLTPGIYALMWRVLSVDTHVTQGFILFDYQP